MTSPPPIKSEYANASELNGLLAPDEETTADLPVENTADLALTPGSRRLEAAESLSFGGVVPQRVETPLTVAANSTPVYDAVAADLRRSGDQPLAPLPQRRALGFAAFVTCALLAILATTQTTDQPSSPGLGVASAVTTPADKVQPIRAGAQLEFTDSQTGIKPAERSVTPETEASYERPTADASLGVVAFQSRSFVTSERAVSAVFILKRTQVVRGRALVHWAVRSGSADAGIDFADAAGTVRFADGQRQVAIYVPLRNDLLSEEDEYFKVCLHSPQHVRVGGRSCAEVTILDDDGIAPT